MNDDSAIAEAKRIFDLQREASRTEPSADAEIRRDRLNRLQRLVRENRSPIIDAISDDFGGRSGTETELLEMVPLLNSIRYSRSRLERWMKPERRPVDWMFQPARAWVQYEPLGVVGIISPWNYPLLLALSPLVDAMAAGNRAMLKPSELTPRFSTLLKELIGEHFSEAEVAVVPGGAELGKAFARMPFDHLLFTGSTEVGREVYQAAAANLTPVTLELGGKSPALICEGYSLEKAARSIAFGKFVNAGQTCIAPDYALVPEGSVDAFAKAVLAQARRSYPSIAGNDDYSSIITDRHLDRLSGAVEQARKAGATILSLEAEDAGPERRLLPTVVLDAPPDSRLMTEEIFGPVLPVIGYRNLEDALAIIGRRERPLALYCFTASTNEQQHLLSRALSGGATINGTLAHVAQDALPFGGVGASGIGAYHGRDGFRRFSHARGVHRIGPVNLLERIGPPWGGGLAKRLLSIVRRKAGLTPRH